VDGQTSTALLVAVLRRLGAKPSYHIPVRAVESHGVNRAMLEKIIDRGAQLVLTCDTGISAHDEVEYARSRGVDMIISDHHDLPLPAKGETARIPAARAVVNPKLLPEDHPIATLPGVGVAYKLAEALCQAAGQPGGADEHLDLVALGIVADVALLRGDARYLLQRGLEVLRKAERPGLRAIMEYAELNPAWLSEEHIGFELAPRLNALGRLSDANPAVELLTTQDTQRARVLALELEGLNARRKLLTSQVFQGALAQIQQEPSLLEPAALVLSHPDWPAGVIGIVAGKLAERYQRPVVLLATPPGEAGRGSARSVEGVNIHAAIAAHGELLNGFGGHPMAAGLSIDPARIPEFRFHLGHTVEGMRGPVQGGTTLQIDAYLPLAEMTLDLATDLERLAPFGAGNPPLTLACRGLRLASAAPLGRQGEHRMATLEDESGVTHRAIWWGGAGRPMPEGVFGLAYTARTSAYRGSRALQIEWVDARARAETLPVLVDVHPVVEVVDYRGQPHLKIHLRQLMSEGELQVWREGEAIGKLEGCDRTSLQPCERLAIWTSPPGPAELRAALERVTPQVVYLFGIPPETDQPQAFLQRLAGLVKYAIARKGGEISPPALAAATAQREVSVRAGLAWLETRGHIRMLERRGDQVVVSAGEGGPGKAQDGATAQLKALLEETSAYRAYFLRANPERLINA
jgi:single-stranded-DNA-specific exonuclease